MLGFFEAYSKQFRVWTESLA
jgi:two pore calcium channel protein